MNRRSLSKSTRNALLITGGLAIGGCCLVVWGLLNISRGLASSEWSTAEGEIVTSKVEQGRSTKGPSLFTARISYEYTIDDRQFNGDRMSFGDYSGSATHAKEIVARYPLGKQVVVHFDPNSPAAAVLEPGLATMPFVITGAGLLLVAIGVFGFRKEWKRHS